MNPQLRYLLAQLRADLEEKRYTIALQMVACIHDYIARLRDEQDRIGRLPLQ